MHVTWVVLGCSSGDLRAHLQSEANRADAAEKALAEAQARMATLSAETQTAQATAQEASTRMHEALAQLQEKREQASYDDDLGRGLVVRP